MNIQIYGIKFIKYGKFGDFEWMCQQTDYENSLFIFNDNEEYHETNKKGKGNAIVRVYNSYNKNLLKPKSFGIPTGTLKNGGYKVLNKVTKNKIDKSIESIKNLIIKYNYDSLYYSVGKNNKLGTNLFIVNEDIIDYIDNQICSLTNKDIIISE